MNREQEYKKELMGKWVKFKTTGRNHHYGLVMSIEHDVCNIKGIEQKKKERSAYHYNYWEVTPLTQMEAFNLGRAIISLFHE